MIFVDNMTKCWYNLKTEGASAMEAKGFIDTHSHILFSVDDGARDIGKSLAMLEKEREEGAAVVFLTPHFYEGERNSSHLAERFEELRQRAKESLPEIELFLGNEIFCMYEPLNAIKSGAARTYADGKYVLLEFAPSAEWGKIREHIVNFLREGYIPVIAHAERYSELFSKKERMREVTALGALIQINCDTFTSAGFFQKRYLRSLLNEDMIFCIGTDAHNLKSRPPEMRDAFNWVVKNAGSEKAEKIFCENAKVLMNK